MNKKYLKCLNIARQYPAYFVPFIQKQLSEFLNERELCLNQEVVYETNEGRSAWNQARSFLFQQKSLPPLEINEGLMRAAEHHRNDICESGVFEHRGTDGSTSSDRILRYCRQGPGSMVEIIGADFDIEGLGDKTAEMMIVGLIIDDGVKDRGHRQVIFSPVFKYVGLCSGKIEDKIFTVFTLTENWLQPLHSSKSNNKSILRSSSMKKPQKQKHSIFRELQNRELQNRQRQNNSKKKKVVERKQNSHTYFENNKKVVTVITQLIFEDGTVEENVQKILY